MPDFIVRLSGPVAGRSLEFVMIGADAADVTRQVEEAGFTDFTVARVKETPEPPEQTPPAHPE